MKLPMTQKKIIGGFDDGIEAAKDVTSEIKDTLIDELGRGSFDTLWKQISGATEMHEGEEIDLRAHSESTGAAVHVEAGINYREEVLHGQEREMAKDNREIEVKIQEIMIELKQVVQSSKELQAEFREVTVEQAAAKAGKYHLNFVEWLLQNVRDIRMRIEDSGAWLASFQSKKDKKGYWNMFKKHGTSFGMSNERSIATNVG